MGTSLREVIFDIGGGPKNGRQIKAVQTGGPSGGCLPESEFHLPLDFDALYEAGSMMGSGGMVVMDDSVCMVDVAKTGAKGSIGRGNNRHIGLPFYQDKYCQKCDECKERCPLEIDPVSKRGKPGGVCGSELSKNDEIPEICEDCVLE